MTDTLETAKSQKGDIIQQNIDS